MIEALSDPTGSLAVICSLAGMFGILSGIMASSPGQEVPERSTARTTAAGGRLLIAVAVLGMSACASNPRVEKLADGRFSIDCSGGTPSWTRCHVLASEACGGGRDGVLRKLNIVRHTWYFT